MHILLPESGLYVIGEAFQRVEHCLLAPRGATIAGLKRAHSHAVALGQVRNILAELNLQAIVEADTAGSAELVAKWNNPEDCAIASDLAAELFGLEVLRRNVEDASHNTTRFYVMSKTKPTVSADRADLMTTFVFRVRNVPAALYKALGGFATNGVNMTKLESYMVGGSFAATQFLCDVEGHPEQPALRRALEELQFFSRETRILGVYPTAPFRKEQGSGD
jgi:prephenate dehydratase